jgi:hypothetical protein
MSKKGLNADFGEVADFGDTFDINDMLEQTPAIEDEEENTVDDEEEDSTDKNKDNKDTDNDLSDINQVLAKSELESGGDDEDDEDDDDEDKDDNKDLDSDPAPDETKKSSSDAPFTVIFARDLMERGILSDFDEEKYQQIIEEKGEAEAFHSLIEGEVNESIEAAKTDLDEGYKHYLEMIGQGVSDDAAASLSGLNDKFSNIAEEDLDSETNDELRKSVLTDYYKLTTRFSDAKIDKLVQNAVDMGDDINESKDALKNIKSLITEQIETQKQEAQRQRELGEQERQRQLEVLKDHINALSEIIPEQRINKQTKEKMYNLITKPVKLQDGRTTNAIWAKRSEDPISFDAKVAYLYETGFFDKDKPWSKIEKVINTKKASELQNYLSKKKNTGSQSGRSVVANDSYNEKNIRKIIDSTQSILK